MAEPGPVGKSWDPLHIPVMTFLDFIGKDGRDKVGLIVKITPKRVSGTADARMCERLSSRPDGATYTGR